MCKAEMGPCCMHTVKKHNHDAICSLLKGHMKRQTLTLRSHKNVLCNIYKDTALKREFFFYTKSLVFWSKPCFLKSCTVVEILMNVSFPKKKIKVLSVKKK